MRGHLLLFPSTALPLSLHKGGQKRWQNPGPARQGKGSGTGIFLMKLEMCLAQKFLASGYDSVTYKSRSKYF